MEVPFPAFFQREIEIPLKLTYINERRKLGEKTRSEATL